MSFQEFGQNSFVVGKSQLRAAELGDSAAAEALHQKKDDAWFVKSLKQTEILQFYILKESEAFWKSAILPTIPALSVSESEGASDASERRNLLLYLFTEQLNDVHARLHTAGRVAKESGSSSDSWQATSSSNNSSYTWNEKKRELDTQLDELDRLYAPTRPLVTKDFDVAEKTQLLRTALQHFAFIQTTVLANIDEYLNAVYEQYQLEVTPLTNTEAEQLAEKLFNYQITHEDSVRHDPNYQFLHLLAGLMSMTSVDRLVENEPFKNQTFHIGDKQHTKISDAVKEFLESIDEDDDLLTRQQVKIHFKRMFTSVLMSDPEASGRYVLLPAVATHRDQSYLQILNKFDKTEQQLPMSDLIQDRQLRVYFADLVAANFVANNLLQPKRWSPAESFRRSLMMKKKAFFNLGKTLASNKRRRVVLDLSLI